MSINPFISNSFQTNTNSFSQKNDNKQNQQNAFFNINNNNSNQQKENIPQNQNLNIFTNTPQASNPFQNNISTKNDSNNPFNLNINQVQNPFNLNNNKDDNKNLSIINTNKNTNNINNDNFFNINNKIKEESKQEEKKEKNNIFLAQSNNLLNKMNNDININKENKINISNNEQKKSNFLLDDVSQILNQNGKKEEKKVDEFLKDLFEEDNLISSNKRMIEYQKNLLNTQTGEEILNDLKSTLFSQKEQFKNYVNNTRLLEEKFSKICKENNENMKKAILVQMKYSNLSAQLDSITQNKNTLEENIEKKHKNISEALDYILKSNNNNIYNFIRKEDLEKKNEFFNDIKITSNKVRKIEDDINIISNIMDKNEKNTNDKEIFFNENYNRNDKNNGAIFISNKNIEGVWIERNNNKLYVTQKETNEIFNECYSGINSFIAEQDEIEKRCDNIKRKLLDKINKKNNNFGNNRHNSDYIGNINNIQGFNYGKQLI